MSYSDLTEEEAAVLNRRPVRGRVELLNDRLDVICRFIEQTERHLDEVEGPDRITVEENLLRLRRRLHATLEERDLILEYSES